jgi:hypothetical protein
MVRRNAYLVSVADGRIDRKIERFEGLCPFVKAPRTDQTDRTDRQETRERLNARGKVV